MTTTDCKHEPAEWTGQTMRAKWTACRKCRETLWLVGGPDDLEPDVEVIDEHITKVQAVVFHEGGVMGYLVTCSAPECDWMDDVPDEGVAEERGRHHELQANGLLDQVDAGLSV